jgi:hypothetical protein
VSMLQERDNDLLDHDKFIRDNIHTRDILVVSIGANDIVIKPIFAACLVDSTWLSTEMNCMVSKPLHE